MAKNDNKSENKVKKHFFKDFKAELKKVIWPTPKQLVNSTVAVVTIVIITAIIVFALDTVFNFGNKYGISNLQSMVDEKFNSKEEENKEEHDHEHGEGGTGDNAEKTEQNQEDTSATGGNKTETPAEGEQTNPEQ